MNRTPLYLLVILLLTGCSSGKTALRHGRFDLAVKRASQRLQQGPGLSKRGHGLASNVLQQAFVLAYEQRQNTIRRLANSTSQPFRWEAVLGEYNALQTLTDNARTCTACADWLSGYPASYQDRMQETRQLAAADRYDVAEQAYDLRLTNRLAAKDAFVNYRKATDWVPDYRQARTRADEVFPYALLRVAIEPIGPTYEISGHDNLAIQRLIYSRLNRDMTPSTFVRLYTPDQIQANIVDGGPLAEGFPIHQAVRMQVTDYTAYTDNTGSSSTTIYSDKEYKVGEKKINDSTKVDIMEKVKGTLTTFKRTISTGMTIRLEGIDVDANKPIWHDSVWETRRWETVWETFSGDDRALNGHILATASILVPSRWQLYDDLVDELAGDVARRIRSKYSTDE
ncbi:hypothetical protein [Spirosoma rhododendri]|uniref:Lipoprotein n=1 Tax=Spirosoma rhododendri TaxID=2728024 RepID=A0A7L5DQP1_9BACT|nr:hypothetical protein [Spirosoma rhododendri]QJD79801.1 hypothetical protein HH216_16295 [Spirosoma rhododendri]